MQCGFPIQQVEIRPRIKGIVKFQRFLTFLILFLLFGASMYSTGSIQQEHRDGAIPIVYEASRCASGYLSIDKPHHATCWIIALEPQSKQHTPMAWYDNGKPAHVHPTKNRKKHHASN